MKEKINYKQILFDWADSYYGCDVCKNNYLPASECESSCLFDLNIEEFLRRVSEDFLCYSCGGCPLFYDPRTVDDYMIDDSE